MGYFIIYHSRVSNSAKTDVMSDFLAFVDANSQPNGRQSGSYSAQFFFHPKFTRIAPPRVGEKNYEEKCHSSLVSEFCRAQRELGQNTCGPSSANDWLKTHRPKVALHPSMTDYCDTCKHLKEELSRVQAIKNRLQQSGSASENELKHEEVKQQFEEERIQHREHANKARDYYKSCKDQCMHQWKQISALSEKNHLTDTKKNELRTLKHCFTLTISADYQQSKLIPTWGRSEQPGSTYYLQKVSHDIFGIVDHRNDNGYLYLFDERIGPQNTDHTISLLMEFWKQESTKFPWIQKLTIYLDNATSTNKNRYLFGWALEMINSGIISYIRISFMIAGHTKFSPDRLFAKVGSAFNVADTFNIEELQALCSPFAETYIEDGENILLWRDTLSQKYSDLPGVRKYHDFLFIRSHTGDVVMKVREQCYTGTWINSPLHLVNEAICGMPSSNYKDIKFYDIKSDKMANMVTMYDKFISPDRRPSYLPTFCSTIPPPTVHQSASQQPSTSQHTSQQPSSASSSSQPPTRHRRPSRCTTAGCDGSGHRNKTRWAEGHTTRAGCPIFHAQT